MEPDTMKLEMDEMKKVKNQAKMIKGMSEMMSKFDNSVIPGPPKETRRSGRKTTPIVQPVLVKQSLRPELCKHW